MTSSYFKVGRHSFFFFDHKSPGSVKDAWERAVELSLKLSKGPLLTPIHVWQQRPLCAGPWVAAIEIGTIPVKENPLT